MWKYAVWAAILSCVSVGCAGYRVGSIAGKDLQGVTSVFVPTVKNESYEPGLPVVTTNAILRKLDNDGTLKTVQSLQADSQLDVVIKSVERHSLRGNRLDGERTEEYEVKITAQATFFNRKLGKKTLDKVTVSGVTKYFVQADQQEAERQALPTAAEDLAQNIVSLVVEGW